MYIHIGSQLDELVYICSKVQTGLNICVRNWHGTDLGIQANETLKETGSGPEALHNSPSTVMSYCNTVTDIIVAVNHSQQLFSG